MRKLNGFLIMFSILLIVGLLIPTVFYITTFSGNVISHDPKYWGLFADYFGGLFNPIIALANLVIFIKLTLIVAEMQHKSTQQALNQEKKILISGLMHDSIKELSLVLNSLGEKIITNSGQTDWEILQVQQTVTTFGNNYAYLFPKIDNREVINDLKTMLQITRTTPYNKQSFADAFENYLNSKDAFIQTLHIQTISKLEN